MNNIIMYSIIGATLGGLHSIQRKINKKNSNIFFYSVDILLGICVSISLNSTYIPQEMEMMAIITSIIIGDFIDYALSIFGRKVPDIIIKFVDKVTDIFLR